MAPSSAPAINTVIVIATSSSMSVNPFMAVSS
jgi:hypothetical protein